MLKVLIPIDGSESSDRAVAHLLRAMHSEGAMDIHLLNVQIPVTSGHVNMFVSKEEIEAYYREEAEQALQRARAALDQAGVEYHHHILVGHAGETIAAFAKAQGFDKIIIGTHGRSAVKSLLMGSVAQDVVRLSDIPVTLVK